MGADSMAAVQAALYEHLAALVPPGLRDHVPKDADFPYIALGAARARPVLAGTDIEVELRVHSRAPGMKETQDILSALREALHGAALEVAGHEVLLCAYLGSEMRAEADGRTRTGTARFRIVTRAE